jgi:hypothetical protein
MKLPKFTKLIYIFLTTCSISCQEKVKTENSQNNNATENNPMIEKILEKQLKQGANQYIDEAGIEKPKKEFETNELEASVQIAKHILISNGYKVASNSDFSKKISEIFKRIINLNSENKYLYINYFDKCDKKFNKNPNNSIDYNGTYVIKNENFIVDFYYVPEILDYKKEFPEIAKIEDNILVKYKDNEGNDSSIELWKNLENKKEKEYNLSIIRQKNIQTIVNRNKYLFNDSRASLTWLKFNDQYFLESLVKTFGYVKDLDLLKWVLNRNLKDEEFDKVLFTKTCDNKYVFHKEIFEIMNQADKSNKEKYIAFLKEHFPKVDKNNFSDETKIQALYCYYSTKLTGSVKAYDMYAFFPRLNDEESEQEFKKNNYYNLSDFKELYDETRFSGVGPAE